MLLAVAAMDCVAWSLMNVHVSKDASVCALDVCVCVYAGPTSWMQLSHIHYWSCIITHSFALSRQKHPVSGISHLRYWPATHTRTHASSKKLTSSVDLKDRSMKSHGLKSSFFPTYHLCFIWPLVLLVCHNKKNKESDSLLKTIKSVTLYKTTQSSNRCVFSFHLTTHKN